MTEVVLYHADGCHLCERARATLERVRLELDFDLREIDIAGDPQLEATYRKWLPVVAIDGKRAFVYHVDETSLRRRLSGEIGRL